MGMADAAGGFLNAVLRGRGKLSREMPTPVPWTPNGDMPPAIPEVMRPLSLGMRRRLPQGMAELVVQPTGDGKQFNLLGAFGDELARDLGTYGKPELDLGSTIMQLSQPVTVLGQLQSWSREKGYLVRWLNDRLDDPMVRLAGLELVVWDDTGFRIPWELFWLPPDPRKADRSPDWLGGLVTVSRWLSIKEGYPEIVQDFLAENPARASGPVRAYVHSDMERDKDLLRHFEIENYDDRISDLLESLKPPEPPLSMVYVACHGDGTQLGDLTLEGASTPGDWGFRRLHDKSTLVFLNACASGVVAEDMQVYNDGALRGFPKMFLAKGAAGVLATAAPIDDDLAHRAARALFERLRRDPGLPVARAVRDLRREAADNLPADIWRTDIPARQQEAANERLLPVLYWFMYLYYGSPRMTISFDPANALPASD